MFSFIKPFEINGDVAKRRCKEWDQSIVASISAPPVDGAQKREDCVSAIVGDDRLDEMTVRIVDFHSLRDKGGIGYYTDMGSMP